jgi:hypothetical protein
LVWKFSRQGQFLFCAPVEGVLHTANKYGMHAQMCLFLTLYSNQAFFKEPLLLQLLLQHQMETTAL